MKATVWLRLAAAGHCCWERDGDICKSRRSGKIPKHRESQWELTRQDCFWWKLKGKLKIEWVPCWRSESKGVDWESEGFVVVWRNRTSELWLGGVECPERVVSDLLVCLGIACRSNRSNTSSPAFSRFQS